MTYMFNPILWSLVITFFYDQVLFCYVCLMHSMYDISWLDIKEKLKFKVKDKVKVQIEMHVKYCYSKCVMT